MPALRLLIELEGRACEGVMTMLLIRHATTDLAGTLCGQSDPPLNKQGREQARALAASLQDARLERLYASNLKRAIETAAPLARSEVPLIVRADLGEIHFGEWEGRCWQDVRDAAPEMQSYEESPNAGAPGGETFDAFRSRVLEAFENVVRDAAGRNSAIFTHQGVIGVILKTLFPNHPNWRPRQKIDYCAVYCLDISRL